MPGPRRRSGVLWKLPPESWLEGMQCFAMERFNIWYQKRVLKKSRHFFWDTRQANWKSLMNENLTLLNASRSIAWFTWNLAFPLGMRWGPPPSLQGRGGRGGAVFGVEKEKEGRNATVAKRKWEEKMVVTHVPKIYCPKATLGEKWLTYFVPVWRGGGYFFTFLLLFTLFLGNG